MRGLGLTLLLCLLSACDVTSVREAANTIAHNECQSGSDCGGGSCIDFQCRGRSSSLQTVLFEVTPPADGSPIAGVQFLTPKDLGEVDLDSALPLALDLGLVSQVVGKVIAKELTCDALFVGEKPGSVLATSNDNSVPALVSLIPSSSTLGLYSPRAVASSAELIASSYFGFSVNVPPGSYDIYVEPKAQPDQTCPVPPQLVRGKKIDGGTLPLDILLPEPSVFEFHVSWPLADGALDGWVVDMLDPVSGRVISNRVALATGAGGTSDYVAKLSYYPVVVVGEASAQQQQDELIRLSPPDNLPAELAAPTILMARSALGLFDARRGTLSDFTALPGSVHVHGQVTTEMTTPEAATVTLVAQPPLTGIKPGVLASFVRTVSVGADGQFDVYLLPGRYQVSTVPNVPLDPNGKGAATLRADSREWTVPSEPSEQAGKVIELARALSVFGQVWDVAGRPVSTAQVQAVASPLSLQSDVLQDSLGNPVTKTPELAFVPRASTGTVSDMGDFALAVDPGTFDISVRPDADTGFAWLVLPNFPVTTTKNGVGLGRMTMPLPVEYGGTVTVPGAEGPRRIPGALIRTYIYMKGGKYTTDWPNADSVVQIAETRADNTGEFHVFIPAELNQPSE